MNIDTIKIGHFTLTNYSSRQYTMYNERTGEVYNILPSEYKWLRDNCSLETCNIVNDLYERTRVDAFNMREA